MNKNISISAELYEKVDEARRRLGISLEEFCESAITSLLVKLPAPIAPPEETFNNSWQAKIPMHKVPKQYKSWKDFH